MAGVWVMTARKIVQVGASLCRDAPGGYEPFLKKDYRVFDVGDVAPVGHEGKPYTRLKAEKE